MLVKVNQLPVGTRDYLSRLQTLFFIYILNGMAKMKLAILPFLCCREIVKNCTVLPQHDIPSGISYLKRA